MVKKDWFMAVGVFAATVAIVVGTGFAYNEYKTVDNEVVEPKAVEHVVEEPEWMQMGYIVEADWQKDLDAKKTEAVGIADEMIEKYADVISDTDSESLMICEDAMVNAVSFAEYDKSRNMFDSIVEQLDIALAEYEEEMAVLEEQAAAEAAAQTSYVEPVSYDYSYSGDSYYSGGGEGVLTRSGGVNYYNGATEKYYNLDMSGVCQNAQNAGIAGNYWVRDDGVKMWGDYVIVASSAYNKGTVIDTSLGSGIVLDYCETPGVNDLAVAW